MHYQHELLGTNARLDELQAAILRVKLPYLDRWNAARQLHARTYSEQLYEVVESLPAQRPWASHVFYVYVVRTRERDQFRRVLEQEGVATGIHYPVPIHLQPACSDYGYRRGMLPETEAAAQSVVSLPMYPELTEGQMQAVIGAVKQAAKIAA